MKKILLILIIAIFITGCIPGLPGMAPDEQTSNDWKTGTNGLTVKFLSGSPPKEVYEDDDLEVAVEVSNKGAYNGAPGMVYLSGYDRSAISFYDNYLDIPPIEGKNQYNPRGSSTMLIFETDDELHVPYRDRFTTKITATACFYYETYATPSVCVIPDLRTYTKGKAVCEPKPVYLTSQAAPIAVTKIEPRIMRDEIEFLITVKNIGEGVVINKNSLNDCPFRVKPEEYNIVMIHTEISGLGASNCINNNMISLDKNGEGAISCNFVTRPQQEPQDASYYTELQITLEYGYLTQAETETTIINPAYTTKGIYEQGEKKKEPKEHNY